MRVIVAYDVSEDRRRARLAALLATWGDRVQKSVFECTVDAGELAEVLARAATIIDPDTDAVHVYHQCSSCTEHAKWLGQARTATPEPYWIV